MKRLEKPLAGATLLVLVGAMVLGFTLAAEAQSQKNPSQLMAETKKEAATGWEWLTTAASFVVGGGALASGGRALYRGEWTTGAVGIGFGIGILLLMWALGNFFDYTTVAGK